MQTLRFSSSINPFKISNEKLLFGGRSGEHEVSLLSAASVLKAFNRKKYR
ncbi:MAG: hypothetical protein WA634_10705 [Silvibacterium sp.]